MERPAKITLATAFSLIAAFPATKAAAEIVKTPMGSVTVTTAIPVCGRSGLIDGRYQLKMPDGKTVQAAGEWLNGKFTVVAFMIAYAFGAPNYRVAMNVSQSVSEALKEVVGRDEKICAAKKQRKPAAPRRGRNSTHRIGSEGPLILYEWAWPGKKLNI